MVEKFDWDIEKTKRNESTKTTHKNELKYEKLVEKYTWIKRKEYKHELEERYKNGLIEQQIKLWDTESALINIYNDYVYSISKLPIKVISHDEWYMNAMEASVVKEIWFKNLVKNLWKENISKIQTEIKKEIADYNKMLSELNNPNSTLYQKLTAERSPFRESDKSEKYNKKDNLDMDSIIKTFIKKLEQWVQIMNKLEEGKPIKLKLHQNYRVENYKKYIKKHIENLTGLLHVLDKVKNTI